MPLPPLVRQVVDAKVGAWCKERVPERVRDKVQVTYVIKGNIVTVREERPHYTDPERRTVSPCVQFRYEKRTNTWRIHWRDRHTTWYAYEHMEPTSDLDEVLGEVDADPTGIFWG